MKPRLQILLVEDNLGDAVYLQRALARADTAHFTVTTAEWLSTALQVAGMSPPDAVLLDLSLPDSQGVDTVVAFLSSFPHLPVLVLTGHDDMPTAINAVRVGAQDYLIKGEIQFRSLERSILYAIERKHADMVGKRLVSESLQLLGSEQASDGPLGLLASGVAQLANVLDEVQRYLARNAPAHSEAVKSIYQEHDVAVVIRELQSMVQAETATSKTSRPPRRSLSSSAFEAVDGLAGSCPPPPDILSAEEALLDVIERRSRYG
jgi:ActR/RegA family two-component response regulator